MTLRCKIIASLLILTPTLAFADNLYFSLTNHSKSKICFESSDFFDFGHCANFNETTGHQYTSPPKNIRLILGNGAYESFYMKTQSSCDELGIEPFREMTHFNGPHHSHYKRYYAGNIHVTIEDLPGSTVNEKFIQCILDKS